MTRVLLLFVLVYLMWLEAHGQPNPKHQLPHPQNPKGVTATQDKAMPYYVEALHYLENNNDSAAIHNLHRSISISNALVEAHLLLADIYLKNGNEKAAMKFYNSGIDFAIEQDTAYYHKLFDLCLKYGEYDVLKHNLKHYKKLYSPDAAEYYFKSIDMIYNVSNWKKYYSVSLLDSSLKAIEDIHIIKSRLWVNHEGNLFQYKIKSNKLKKKKQIKSKSELSAIDAFTKTNNDQVLVHVSGKKEIDIYELKRARRLKKVGTVVSDHTNFKGMCAIKENQLIVSSAITGSNYSLYNLTIDDGNCTMTEAPYFDSGNEVLPTYIDGVFYYSSDGEPSFGNQDIYVCEGYEILKGAWLPNNPKNAKAQVNGHTIDKKIIKLSDDVLIVWKEDNKGKHYLMMLTRNPIKVDEMLWETFE